jgi:hypothetical protein
MAKRLDDWRRKQDDLPGRPENIRRLVELGLAVGKTKPAKLNRRALEKASKTIGGMSLDLKRAGGELGLKAGK